MCDHLTEVARCSVLEIAKVSYRDSLSAFGKRQAAMGELISKVTDQFEGASVVTDWSLDETVGFGAYVEADTNPTCYGLQ